MSKSRQKCVILPADFYECERGNTLLSAPDGDGRFIAWIEVEDGVKLEIAWSPENYPSLVVGLTDKSDEELVSHIDTNLTGWIVHKLNLKGAEHLSAGNSVLDKSDAQ